MKLNTGEEIPLSSTNLLLRGCIMRNTERAYGVVVYTGHETKIMMNSTTSEYKFSELEKGMNLGIAVILCTQLLLAILGAGRGTFV